MQDGDLKIRSLLMMREAMIAKHAGRFLIQPDCLSCIVIWARYGTWSQGSQI